MNNFDRLNLEKMIKTNNVEDCTQEIRDKGHSILIQNDLNKLESHIRSSLNASVSYTKKWFLNEISKHHGNEPEANSDPKLILVLEELIHSLENNADYEIEQSTINTYYVTLSRLKTFQIDVKNGESGQRDHPIPD